jgi:hypothetical protein
MQIKTAIFIALTATIGCASAGDCNACIATAGSQWCQGTSTCYPTAKAKQCDYTRSVCNDVTYCKCTSCVDPSCGAPPPSTRNHLVQGQVLAPGEELLSGDVGAVGAYKLIMQLDGNCVLYAANTAIWNTSTANSTYLGNQLRLDGDGLLELTDVYTGKVLWAPPGLAPRAANDFYAIMQGDSNFVIYEGTPAATGLPTWSTGGGVWPSRRRAPTTAA